MRWAVVVTILALSCVVNSAPPETVDLLFGYYGNEYINQISALEEWLSRATFVNQFDVKHSSFDSINFRSDLFSTKILVLGSSGMDYLDLVDYDDISQFVRNGGVLVVPTYDNIDHSRSATIAGWLSTPQIYSYYQPYEPPVALGLEIPLQFDSQNGNAYLTMHGLGTPFARLAPDNYPTDYDYLNAKFSRYSPSYQFWRPEGDPVPEHCMFQTEDGDCWIYAFPVEDGWQVNVPFNFNNNLVNDQNHIKNLFLAIAGLSKGNVNNNVKTDNTTLVYFPSNSGSGAIKDARKLLSDINAVSDNMFVFTRKNPLIPDEMLFSEFQIQSVVIPNYPKYNSYYYVDFDYYFPFDWLENQNALVITLPGNTLGDKLYTYVNYGDPEESDLTTNKTFVFNSNQLNYSGFGNINEVYFPLYVKEGFALNPYTEEWYPFSHNSVFEIPAGSTSNCIFTYGDDCIFFTKDLKDGHVSFMSKPNREFYPYFTPDGMFEDSKWQRESLRALVGASLDPTGEPVNIPGPVLVPSGNIAPLNVLFVNTPGVRTAGVAGYMLNSLNNNVHSVNNINDIPDKLSYGDYDAIVIPGVRANTYVTYSTRAVLQDFMNDEGKRIAWLVDKNRADLYNYYSVTDIFPELYGYYTVPAPDYNYYNSPLVSHTLTLLKNPEFKGGALFDSIEDDTVYPFFINKNVGGSGSGTYRRVRSNSNVANSLLSPRYPYHTEDCVISFVDGQCATMYYEYGAGAFTIISTAFQYGYQYWIEDYAPWANMLLRAVGGDPNAPPSPTPTTSQTPSGTSSRSETVTPTGTTSVTPTETSSATSTGTPSVTATNTPTVSPTETSGATSTGTPSVTTTNTPTVSPTETPSATSTGTPSVTATNSPSVSPTRTPSNTQSNTPSTSPTDTPSESPTNTPSITSTITASVTSDATSTPTNTATQTTTETPTWTPSITSTTTETGTSTMTQTVTPSRTLTPTWTPTMTQTGTQTHSPSVSITSNPTGTPTRTETRTSTHTPTTTVSLSASHSPTPSPFGSIIPSSSSSHSLLSLSSSVLVTHSLSLSSSVVRSSIVASISDSPSTSHIVSPVLLPPDSEPSLLSSRSPSITPSSTLFPSSTRSPSSREAVIGTGDVMLVLPDKEVGESKEVIQIASPDGKLSYGSIRVPDKFSSGVLSVTVLSREEGSDLKLATPIFDIILHDSQSNEVHELDESLEICFDKPEKESKHYCLGYYKEARGWTCEDKNLGTRSDEYCGNTDHLTNFALLLTGNGNDSSEESYVIAWIALGFISVAIILICLSTVAIEARYRHSRRVIHKKLTRGSIQM